MQLAGLHNEEGLLFEDRMVNGGGSIYTPGIQPGDVFGVAVNTTTGRTYGLASRILIVVGGRWPPTDGYFPYDGNFLAVAVNPVTSKAYVSRSGPPPLGNNVAVLIEGADLEITQSAIPNPALVGGEVTYNLTVTNHGPETATHAVATDLLPAGTAADSCSTTAGTCGGSTSSPSVTLDSLAAGSSVSIALRASIACSVANQASLTSTASVTADVPDPAPGNNTAVATVIAIDPAPVLTGLAVNPAVLWPPNHKLANVTVSYSVSDNCPLPAGSWRTSPSATRSRTTARFRLVPAC